MAFKVGVGKKEMNVFIPGLGMMGYGQAHNVVKEAATPLFARAVVFEDANLQKFIFINLELAFVTIAVKEEVTARLQALFPQWSLSLASLMMTAQHTHSAPGGYSHYPFYNFTIPGFRRQIFEAVVVAAVQAVESAAKTVQAASLRLGHYDIPPDRDVAFNRSMTAYLSNPEVEKITAEESHLAVDRKMQGLTIFDAGGKPLAHLNWFGVHATSISSYNQRIHHDNKGVAAALFEKATPGALAIFAQGAAGDVSPNYIWDQKIRRMRGKFTDQYESAAYNGELQFSASKKISTGPELSGAINCRHLYFDMSIHAGEPAHGVSFFTGTLEGPGLPQAAGLVLKWLSRALKLFKNTPENRAFFEAHGKKDVLLDHRNNQFLGLPLGFWKALPDTGGPVVGSLIRQAKSGALETHPWVPQVLPFQIVTLGDLMLVGVPGEITTVAAERLKAALQKKNPQSEIIISSYANAYMGYVTTPEEYDLQCYEGGHTVYGRNTLPAMIKGFEMLLGGAESSVKAFVFPEEELKLRTWD